MKLILTFQRTTRGITWALRCNDVVIAKCPNEGNKYPKTLVGAKRSYCWFAKKYRVPTVEKAVYLEGVAVKQLDLFS